MEEPDGISTIEIGWDLDLVLLADGKKWGLRFLGWRALMRIQVRAKNCRAFRAGETRAREE